MLLGGTPLELDPAACDGADEWDRDCTETAVLEPIKESLRCYNNPGIRSWATFPIPVVRHICKTAK